MRKILSALFSTLQGGVRGGLLFLALLATTTLWAYDFQSGDLYYNITSDTTVEVTYQYQWSSDNYAGLTTATIPETVTHDGINYSVTSIGEWAFGDCSSLTSITIPNSVTSIGDDAFYGCSSLTSITVENGNSIYDSRENCNAVIETATNTLIAGCQNTIIPNSVTSIGNRAFSDCSSLTSITIPNSVTSIESSAFSYCRSLTSITIPNSVTSIGYGAFSGCDALPVENNLRYADTYLVEAVDETLSTYSIKEGTKWIGDYAFYRCSALTSITIPNSVTSIGNNAFSACESLTSITIPNSVTSIGDEAFSVCFSLTSIAIPNSVTSIGDGAFSACSSLTSITIPNSVTSIGDRAFSACESLTSITIPNSVTSIGDNAFWNCSSLTSITIPNSVTSIGDLAFYGCSSLSSITIPNSVTSIGYEAFCDCFSLTSITIPNSVTSIGSWAFQNCSSLTSVTIPNSVTSIGGNAFWGCESLKTVICEAIEVPELGNNVFYDMPISEATLYVPAQSLDDYKAAEQWKEFGTILPIEGESEEEIELNDTEMTIVFTNSEDSDSEIYRETITIKVPTAPAIAGFTFLYWQPVAEPITNEITIQAIYEADTPTSAEVYTNPANPTQKLLRNGQVYILQDGKTYTITGQKL